MTGVVFVQQDHPNWWILSPESVSFANGGSSAHLFESLRCCGRCLCSSRWLQAQRAGKAPLVILESTHERATDIVPLEVLLEYRSDVGTTVESPIAKEL